MSEKFSRTVLMIGDENLNVLKDSRVAVFGLGGVGGYVVEALARAGVGAIDVIDNDIVAESNINRQILATEKTIGLNKTDVAEARVKDINSDISVHKFNLFYVPETSDKIDFSKYDYVVDAIDTVAGKLEIVVQASRAGVPAISSMGTGNKMNPELFEVADIYKTSVCPLARVMRQELRKRSIEKLKVVYSKEIPVTPEKDISDNNRRRPPASVSFVPPVAGLIIAGEVIKDLIGYKN